jgi:hypothetical protein
VGGFAGLGLFLSKGEDGDFLNAECAKVSQRAQKREEKEDKIEENIKANC